MKAQKITIKDIATMANVSVSAVSRVLNNRPIRISPDKKEEIIRIAAENNYSANYLAASLKGMKTDVIGMIIPDYGNLFFSELANAFSIACEENGYRALVRSSNNNVDNDLNSLRLFIDMNCAAVIISISRNYDPEQLRIFSSLAKTIPIIMIDKVFEEVHTKCLLTNHFLGGYLATTYLIDIGHERIACLTGPKSVFNSVERTRGYRQALIDNSLPPDDTMIFEGDYSIHSAQIMLPKILGKRATAVFAQNDMMALGIYKEAKRFGIQIPQDLSIIGYDNIYLTDFLEPPLTTIAQPIDKLVGTAIDIIKDSGIGNQHEDIHTHNPYLIVRGSCQKPTPDAK